MTDLRRSRNSDSYMEYLNKRLEVGEIRLIYLLSWIMDPNKKLKDSYRPQ